MEPIRSLKPFDFAQAAARAGLGVDGQPLAAALPAMAAAQPRVYHRRRRDGAFRAFHAGAKNVGPAVEMMRFLPR